ncbi:MAG TPA: MlaD family protein [Gemmatimonadales bacterium]|nr:MlaD family protein [Gemmatimonadales bacterium]
MDLHYKQEITVGALVIVGAALFIGGAMWLGGRSFSRGPTVTIVFPNVETLKRGSPLRVSGLVLGTVREIDYEGYQRVLVRSSLDPRVQLKRDASATLASVGLVADAVINLNPGSAAEPLPEGTIIEGRVEAGLLSAAPGLTERASEALAAVSEIANKRLANDISATLDAVQRLANLYSNPRAGPSADLTRTLEEVRRMGARLDSTLSDIKLRGTMETADSMMRNLTRLSSEARATAERLDTALARMSRGEGSLGRLATDTAFYANATETLRALREFVDDIRKHPGKLNINFRVF